VASLERRRLAGTLLEGKCTAAEEAWSAAQMRDGNFTAAESVSLAKLVGYRAFLQAGAHLSSMLSAADLFAGECSAAQFLAFAQHVVKAAELMQQPRLLGTLALNAEAYFAKMLSAAAKRLAICGRDPRVTLTLMGTWQRLQQSGVLETRGTFEQIQRHPPISESNQAVAAAMAAPGLRTCALAGCGAKEAHPKHFKSCGACRAVVYCSKEHQAEGWPSHKKACKAATKAAAAASSDGGAAS